MTKAERNPYRKGMTVSKTQEILAALTVEEQTEAIRRATRYVDETPGTMQDVIRTLALRCARLEVALEKKA